MAFPESSDVAGGDTGLISQYNNLRADVIDNHDNLPGIPVIRAYTSGATWTKPANLKYIVVEVQAAGGNGGAHSHANWSDNSNGGGGGAGGYSKKIIAVASLGATETIIVGAVGSNSSFGSIITCNKGNNASGSTRGIGGTATGGDINVTGGDGSSVRDYGNTQPTIGGSSFFGGSKAYGSGGLGGSGGGYPAIVIVTEYSTQ